MRLLKKIYVGMDGEENNDEDKENVENSQECGKKESKKAKKRRLQELHPSDDEKPGESEAVRAAAIQTRVVQYLKVK